MVAFDGRRERAGATDRVGREKPCGDCVAERCPSEIAARRIGAKFHESDSDSIAMVVLESDKKLGAEAHRYYDGLVKKLQADPKHVQHVQNVWAIHSPPPVSRAETARPPMSSSTWLATRAAPWEMSL
ncbi:MMPL family protein [Mycobacterium xenopi 4042]|uniref:MMPL family protein n=1 Tax=Mycobacterium xenopi 4042 TaxID=1299334 RepID=X8ARM8_MYCXE|nr:MMPL family protein [Mycobacterium xenopi 4042]